MDFNEMDEYSRGSTGRYLRQGKLILLQMMIRQRENEGTLGLCGKNLQPQKTLISWQSTEKA